MPMRGVTKHHNTRSTSTCSSKLYIIITISTLLLFSYSSIIQFIHNTINTSHQSPNVVVVDDDPNIETTSSSSNAIKTTTASMITNKVIDRSESSFPKETVQMSYKQVEYILQHLPEINGNILVWGLGYDSIYWNSVTTGTVIFLEDGDMITNLVPNPDPKTNQIKKMVRWYDSMMYQYPQQLHAYTVNYTTQNTLSELQRYKAMNPQMWEKELYIHDLPKILFETMWDVIIVDAPLGVPNRGPGRFQSLYMTKIIAHHTIALKKQQQQHDAVQPAAVAVHVFVDDYERRVEREFALNVFDPIIPKRITPRPAYKQHVTPNEQAHFIIM